MSVYGQPPALLTRATYAPPERTPYVWAAIATAVVGAVATFLPWVKADAMFAHVEASGIDGDGRLTMWLSVAAGLVAFGLLRTATNRRVGAWFVGLLGAAIAVIAGIDLADATNKVHKANEALQGLGRV